MTDAVGSYNIHQRNAELTKTYRDSAGRLTQFGKRANGGNIMTKLTALRVLLPALVFSTATAFAAPSAGALAFEANCSECHPRGTNAVTPAKDLRTSTLKANGILTAKDIVAKMRKPGPGMTKFDPKDLSDQEAQEIAEYVLATFK
jgi:cytochrome c6